ncbi:MAG: hypothetical protein NVS9B10_28520 [Nevskia sp.]
MRRFRLLLLLPLLAAVAAGAAEPAPPAIAVTPLFKTTSSWDGTPLHYPEGQAEITAQEVTLAPGAETGWHLHPAPAFGLILDGEWTVTLKDGRTKTLRRGDGIVEVVDTLHNGRNSGSVPARLLVFYAGVVGQTLSQKAPAAVP